MEPAAAAKVFSIMELTEMILLLTDFHTILHTQLVNCSTYATIAGSTKLQKKSSSSSQPRSKKQSRSECSKNPP
jgi:hypothetical protein